MTRKNNVLIYSKHNGGSGIYIHLLSIRTLPHSLLIFPAVIKLIVLKPEFHSVSRLTAETVVSLAPKEARASAHVKGMRNDKQEEGWGPLMRALNK
jgi:hypothetical protein